MKVVNRVAVMESLEEFTWPKFDETDMHFPVIQTHPALYTMAHDKELHKIETWAHEKFDKLIQDPFNASKNMILRGDVQPGTWKYAAYQYLLCLINSPNAMNSSLENPAFDQTRAVGALILLDIVIPHS